MQEHCCQFLLNEIAFYNNSIRPCCSFSIDKNNLFSNNYDGDIEGIQKYLSIRESYIKQFINGKKPPCYDGCTIYIDGENFHFKLKNIVISHRSYCSFNCIYCEHTSYGNEKIRSELNRLQSYDIKPILNHLKDNNLIDTNCRFLLCGGECTEYPEEELAFLLYFALSTNGYLLMLSSGIKYSPLIANTLKIPNNVLKISVDSGTSETFKKIKRVNAFDLVWNNIRKYISVSKKHKAHNAYVELKYIIIPGINDTIKEVDAFIKRCKEVGCEYVRIDVEHKWILENKYKKDMHKNINIIINYFFDNLYHDKSIKIDFEGVEKEWLFSFVKDKYGTTSQIGR